MPENGEPPGGSGGESEFTARDSRMVERAIKGRWPIPDEMREKVPEALSKVITSPGSSQRNKIAAARALLAADSLNMEQEKRDAGGENINVNVNDTRSPASRDDLANLTPDELARRHLAALANSRRDRHTGAKGN